MLIEDFSLTVIEEESQFVVVEREEGEAGRNHAGHIHAEGIKGADDASHGCAVEGGHRGESA